MKMICTNVAITVGSAAALDMEAAVILGQEFSRPAGIFWSGFTGLAYTCRSHVGAGEAVP